MLGPIHPAEGCVPFLRALAEIGTASEGWKLVLAGPESHEWRRMLEAAIRRKGGADRVKLASAPNLDAQRAWLAGATILADPSLRIHGPVSILQAIASGVPVLASTRVVPPGLEQVICVCPPRRGAFKQALLDLFALNAEQRDAIAMEARELGRALFDWPVLAERYVEFYRRLI
jgi:glycosyltransferase involved in cell wall biosynthesis